MGNLCSCCCVKKKTEAEDVSSREESPGHDKQPVSDSADTTHLISQSDVHLDAEKNGGTHVMRDDAGGHSTDTSHDSPIVNGNFSQSNKHDIDTCEEDEMADGLSDSVCRENNTMSGPPLDERTMDFPFFNDSFTVKLVQNSKIMFIMRGLSGSGKSAIVRLIQRRYSDSLVCSADDFFVKNGVYDYNVKLLGDAHDFSHNRAKEACENGVQIVIIDNTNVRGWEMRYYYNLALTHSYIPVLVMPKTSWALNAKELSRRNTHGVKANILTKKVRDFVRIFPLYYSWWLTENDSRTITDLGQTMYDICLKSVPQLQTLLQMEINKLQQLGNSDTTRSLTLANYFGDKRSSLHCTSIFCVPNKADWAQNYHKSETTKLALGKAFRLEVIGFTITPRTLSARVRLSDEALQLWAKQHEETIIPESDTTAYDNANYTQQNVWNFRPLSGDGRSAHLTLGTAPGIENKEAGHDNLLLAKTEADHMSGINYISLDNEDVAVARFYEYDDICAVYLHQARPVLSIFSPYY